MGWTQVATLKGPPGQQGNPGIQGPPGIVWRGTWNSTTTYNLNDGVQYQGASWIAIGGSTNQPPSTNSAYWNLLASGATTLTEAPSDGGVYARQNVSWTQIATPSGKTTDFIDGTYHTQDLGTAVRAFAPTVRSYNAIGNPNFTIDQRTAGVGTTGNGTFGCDRWFFGSNVGAGAWVPQSAPSGIIIGGQCISVKFLRYTLATQKPTLAAGDLSYILQFVEGPRMRELLGGPTNATLVVRSSVATTFGITVRDQGSAYSLTKLCTIPTANVWTVIPLPIAAWSASGTFGINPGVVAYTLGFGLAAGTTYTAPSNDIWVAGNFVGAAGQANFAANPVGSTFDIAWVQHEPGTTSAGLIDLPFIDNLQHCKRYYQTSGEYGVPFPIANATGESFVIGTAIPSNPSCRGGLRFIPEMAKTPTLTCYDYQNPPVVNQGFIDGTNAVVIGAITLTTKGVTSIATTPTNPAGVYGGLWAQWKADTTW